jgi:hypothetical protein
MFSWDSLMAKSFMLVIIISSFCSSWLAVMKCILWVMARLFNQAHMSGSCNTPLSIPVLSRPAPMRMPRSILCECYGLLKWLYFIMFIWHSWNGFDLFNQDLLLFSTILFTFLNLHVSSPLYYSVTYEWLPESFWTIFFSVWWLTLAISCCSPWSSPLATCYCEPNECALVGSICPLFRTP